MPAGRPPLSRRGVSCGEVTCVGLDTGRDTLCFASGGEFSAAQADRRHLRFEPRQLLASGISALLTLAPTPSLGSGGGALSSSLVGAVDGVFCRVDSIRAALLRATQHFKPPGNRQQCRIDDRNLGVAFRA